MWVPPSWARRLLHLQQHQQTAACCQASVTTPSWCSWQLLANLRYREAGGLPHQPAAHGLPGDPCLPAAVPSPWAPSVAASVVSESLSRPRGCPGSDPTGKSTLGGIGPGAGSSRTPSVLVQPPLAAAGTGRAQLSLPDARSRLRLLVGTMAGHRQLVLPLQGLLLCVLALYFGSWGPLATAEHKAAPNASSVAPNASSVAPNASSVAPNASSVAPNASSVAPNASSVAPNASSVAPNASSVAPNASSVAPNASVNSTEGTLLTCQSFQCSGERCYQDEAYANETATCPNETFCEHKLHSQVQQRVRRGAVQDQQQRELAAVRPGVLRHPALPAAQCQLLR
nr:uncharacterized protein LOC125183903 isoform X2 [Anser cygnoides]